MPICIHKPCVQFIIEMFCRKEMCLNGYRNYMKDAQVSATKDLMHKRSDAPACRRLMTTLGVLVNSFCRIVEWQ